MLFNVFAVSLIALVVILGFARGASVASPIMLLSYGWGLAFSCGIFVWDQYEPITTTVAALFILWFSIQALPYLLVSGINRSARNEHSEIRALPFDYTYLIVIAAIWLAIRAAGIAQHGSGSMVYNLRMAAIGSEGYPGFGLLERLYPLILALFIFENYFTNNKNRHRRAWLWLWLTLYSISTMSKLVVLTFVIAYFILLFFRSNVRVGRLLIFFAGVFICISGIQLLRIPDLNSMWLKHELYWISLYTYSPIVALGHAPINSGMVGGYVFRFFYVLLAALGSDQVPAALIKEFVFVPLPTNVYTAMGNLFFDFGEIGVLLGAILYSIIFSTIYYLALRGSALFRCIYAFIASFILFEFFDGFLFIGISQVIQVIFWLWIIFVISREGLHNRHLTAEM